MSVRIGQASIDERGKIAGGSAGNQTGKELNIKTWYKHSSGWDFIIRVTDREKAKSMARMCESAVANKNIGYDQKQRNTILAAAKKVGFSFDKVGLCECDCSSLMSTSLIAAGYPIPLTSGKLPATSTMRRACKTIDGIEIYEDAKYLTSSNYLLEGDIIVAEGHHTVMALDDGVNAGKTSTTSNSSDSAAYPLKTFIKEIQSTLGVTQDGIAGPITLSKTITISRYHNNMHQAVRFLQKRLNALGFDCGTVDGIAGKKFEAAVIKYQKQIVGLSSGADGELTAKARTWRKILGML